MGAHISASEFALVLRGWRDDERRLRVVLKSPFVTFGVFGTAFDASEDGLTVSITESSMIAVSLMGCTCGFLESKEREEVLGEVVESGLVAVRPSFELAIVLLA